MLPLIPRLLTVLGLLGLLIGVVAAQAPQAPEGPRVAEILAAVAAQDNATYRCEPESLGDIRLGIAGRGQVPRRAARAWLDAVLLAAQLAVEPVPGTARVFRVIKADARRNPRFMKRDDSSLAAAREGPHVVTRFPLKFVSAETAYRTLRAFRIAHPGALTRGPDDRSLLVSGSPGLLLRVERLLNFVDSAQAGRERRYGSLRLENHDATELEEALRGLFATEDEAGAAVRVSADPRTNAVVVTGSEDDVAGLLEISALMDLEAHRPESRLRAYRLDHAQAEEMAESLRGAFGLSTGSSTSTDRRDRSTAVEDEGASPAPSSGDATERASSRRTSRSTARQISDEDAPRIMPLVSQNAIVVHGTRLQHESIGAVLDELDRPRRTIQIDVVVADISEADAERLGVELATRDTSGSLGHFISTAFGLSTFVGGDARTATRVPALDFSGLAAGVFGGSVGLPLIMQAIEEKSSSRIVTTFATAVNEFGTANLRTSDQRPTLERIDTVRRDGLVADPGVPIGPDDFRQTERFRDYEDASSTLTVTPLRFDGEAVRLNVSVELQEFGDASGDAALPPARGGRSLSTSITVKSGATVALGHLRETSERVTQRGIPGLSDLPVVGGLFGVTATDRDERLLSFFLTVRVLD